MAEEDVLGQADALMRRYRSFVARPADEAPPAQAGSAAGEADDLPVLTEIVAVPAGAPRAADAEAILDALRGEIDAAVAAWLAEVLPAAVAGVSRQLLAELDAAASAALLPRLREIIAARRDEAERGQSL